jgi:Zn-dependent protease
MNLLSLLFREPLVFVAFIGVFLVSLSVHEAAHALAGFLLGDMTAKREGRLTLNPIAHIDPLGFLSLLLLGFGWGKPVPFNPYQLRWQRLGPVLVAAAGPISNFLMGAVATLGFVWAERYLGSSNLLTIFLSAGAFLNFSLALFNLIPIPPLDGSKALLALLDEHRYRDVRYWIAVQGQNLLLVLVVLDMFLPIGPLSWITRASAWLIQVVSGVVGADVI